MQGGMCFTPFSRSLKALIQPTRVSVKYSTLSHSCNPNAQLNEESLSRYCKGGYHPVRIGDCFKGGAYEVVNKLGYGQYATVWLARDTGKKCHVALKVITADAFEAPDPIFELDILRQMSNYRGSHQGCKHVLGLIDDFEHQGPNGEHRCLVFKAMGPDLAKYRKLFPGARIPIPIAKSITKQLLVALCFLHDANRVIHTDIKPQNILVETNEINDMFAHAPSEVFAPESRTKGFYLRSEQISSAEEDLASVTDIFVRLTDFGTSSWFDRHLTEWIQPQMLRAPEVTLGVPWDFRVDIFNLGALIWELVEGKVLFDGTATPQSPYSPEAHLAQMISVLGEMPKSLLQNGTKSSLYFDPEGKLLVSSPFPSCSLERYSDYPDSLHKNDYLEFIQSMLKLDPEERLDTEKLLGAKWLQT